MLEEYLRLESEMKLSYGDDLELILVRMDRVFTYLTSSEREYLNDRGVINA